MNHVDPQIASRLALAKRIALEAGMLGLEYFGRLGELTVTSKGHQDMVSEADRDVETFLRAEIAKSFPDDGILGEEHGLERRHLWLHLGARPDRWHSQLRQRHSGVECGDRLRDGRGYDGGRHSRTQCE